MSETRTGFSDVKRALLEKRLRGVAGAASPVAAIRRREHDAPPRLSFAQERLWFLDQLEPGGSVYNLPTASRLLGPLDMGVLGRVLSEVVRRHEPLRTIFREGDDGVPVQVVEPARPVELPIEEIPELPAAEREAELHRRVNEEATRPFDLARGPVFRARLFRLSPREHVLVVTLHHVASDGWSGGILSREMDLLYTVFAEGRPSPLPELPVRYRDYAVWQREQMDQPAMRRQLDYWREQLRDLPVFDLPFARPRPATIGFRGALHRFTLGPEIVAGVKAFGRAAGVTQNITLTAAFYTLLHALTGREDLVVGSMNGNRNHAETEGLIGFFVNAVALRADLSGDPSFREVVRRTRDVVLAGGANQDVPFDQVVSALRIPRDPARHPVFGTMFFLHAFVARNAPDGGERAAGVEMRSLYEGGLDLVDTGISKFDLTMGMVEVKGAYAAVVEYASDLFHAADIARFVEHYRAVVEMALADLDRPLSSFALPAEAAAPAPAPRRRGGADSLLRQVAGLSDEEARALLRTLRNPNEVSPA